MGIVVFLFSVKYCRGGELYTKNKNNNLSEQSAFCEMYMYFFAHCRMWSFSSFAQQN